MKKRKNIKAIMRGRGEQAIRYRPKLKLPLPKTDFNEKTDQMESFSSNRWKN